MNTIIAQSISLLANLILGSDTFVRVIAAVKRWEEKELANAEKRHGVIKELEIIGLKLTDSLANLAVELAVSYLKYVGGQSVVPPSLAEIEKEVKGVVSDTLTNAADSIKS